MSVTLLQAQDISQYARDVAVNSNDPPSPTGAYRIQGVMDGIFTWAGLVYLHYLDRYVALGQGASPGTPGAQTSAFYKLDPFFVRDSPPDADFRHVHPSSAPTSIFLGAYDPQTGLQRAYTALSTHQIVEIDFVTMQVSGVAAYSGPNGDFVQNGSDVSIFTDGGWAPSNFNPYRGLFFEGMKNGIPNETIAQGSNVYPDGLFLTLANGNLNGNQFSRVLCWIDVRTRRLVGFLGADPDAGLTTPRYTSFPGTVDATPAANSNFEGPIASDEFDWGVSAFYPDADSSAATPKGFLFASTYTELPVITSSVPGDIQRLYMRFTDFNPFGIAAASGQPERVHGRIELTTRMVPVINTFFGLAGVQSVSNPVASQPMWDPVRGRFVLILSNQGAVPVTANGDCAVGFYSPAPEPVFVSSPAARSVPRTNAITEFQSVVSGDIGELIAGVPVNWTLTRRSTLNETLTITGGIGTTSTVANPPIDGSVPATNQGTLRIFADGIELAEGTDFTVVLATGVITWVTDQQGAALVTARYEHRGTPASPSFGNLLSASSQTDENGQAITRVRYPDNDSIVGQLDHLESDSS